MRFFLLLRQKIAWMTGVFYFCSLMICFVMAQVSFVNAHKIFWDFAMGIIFVSQLGLVFYLCSSLLHEEKQKRSLDLTISTGVSRASWLAGNVLGVWVLLSLLALAAFVFCIFISFLSFEGQITAIHLQSFFLILAETLVVAFMSFFFSLFFRPLLAQLLSLCVLIFLHSSQNINRILEDPMLFRLPSAKILLLLSGLSKLLPPFDWFDLKPLLGYESSIAWSTFTLLLLLSAIWTFLLYGLSLLKLKDLDL